MKPKKKPKSHPVGGYPERPMDYRKLAEYVGVDHSWVIKLKQSGRLKVWPHPEYTDVWVVDRDVADAWRARVIETNRGNSRAVARFRSSVPRTYAELEAKVGPRAADYLASIHKLYGREHLMQVELAKRDGLELDAARLQEELGIPVVETVAVHRSQDSTSLVANRPYASAPNTST